MKNRIDDLDKTYRLCVSTGSIKEKSADIELISSMMNVAERGLDFIKRNSRDIARSSTDWTFVFRDHYESLRGMIEALLLLDGIQAENHQCKNACICTKHRDLDWEFLETVRLKRNAINYKGHILSYDDWKDLRLNFDLHISVLREKIEARLSHM